MCSATPATNAGIWVLYRYGGVRLVELDWTIDANLCIEVEDGEQWTLYVHGKGGKSRAIPLPVVAIAPLSAYRADCRRNRLRMRYCR